MWQTSISQNKSIEMELGSLSAPAQKKKKKYQDMVSSF